MKKNLRKRMARWTFAAWFILAIGLLTLAVQTVLPIPGLIVEITVVCSYPGGFLVLTTPVYTQIQIDKQDKLLREQQAQQEIKQEQK